MFDFFDMPTLSAVLQDVLEELNEEKDDTAIAFAKHVLTMRVPCIATPLYSLYTEENAVIRYAQQFLKCNQELGIAYTVEALARHAAPFDYADTPMLTPESVNLVLERVNEVFPYAKTAIGDNPLEILLIEFQHESRNGESTAIFTPTRMHGSICIYQLQDDCTAEPEHILLHELGHLIHMRATGTITDVPASFIDYLSQLGTDCSKLTTAQLQEIFADTFMLAVVYMYPTQGVPIDGIPPQAQEMCYACIRTIFDQLN